MYPQCQLFYISNINHERSLWCSIYNRKLINMLGLTVSTPLFFSLYKINGIIDFLKVKDVKNMYKYTSLKNTCRIFLISLLASLPACLQQYTWAISFFNLSTNVRKLFFYMWYMHAFWMGHLYVVCSVMYLKAAKMYWGNCRGFIKGRAPGKLTDCEHDFAWLLYISKNFFLLHGTIKNSFKLQ